MSDQPAMPSQHEIMREFRGAIHEMDLKLDRLAESNARLEKQVIGNGRMGIADKVKELEDLVERLSEVQMRHLRESKDKEQDRLERDEKRRESRDALAKENRQFKRNIILAALGVILTNVGAWVIFYLTNA